MSQAGWTEDRVGALKKLWLEGLSASQVAQQLGGVTRNAVIGKVHRLGLSGRAAPSAPRRAAGVTPRKSRPPRPATASRRSAGSIDRHHSVAAVAVLEASEGPGLLRLVTQLHGHVCKWPIGDPLADGFSFCGQQTSGGPYCPGHAGKAHQPAKAKPLTRDRLVRRVLAGYAA